MKKYLYVSPYYEEPSFKSYFNSINLINNTDWLTTNNHLILNKKNLKKTSLFNYLENNSNKYDLIFFCSNSILLNKIEIIKLSKSNKLVLSPGDVVRTETIMKLIEVFKTTNFIDILTVSK